MKKLHIAVAAAFLVLSAQGAMASCKDIDRNLRGLMEEGASYAASQYDQEGGYHGLGLPMWVTVVDETGMVCEVVNSGGSGTSTSHDSWLGSRIISAQKANTANAFSTDGVSISTAALFGVTQPGASLYGLQHSNPVDASRAYGGSPSTVGSKSDFLRNKRIGGVNVFGGGLALYKNGVKVGAVGVSGDTSCADHAFATLVRQDMGLDDSDLSANLETLVLSDAPAGNFEHARCGAGEGSGDAGTEEAGG